jgi:hypothetical protein
VYTWYVATSICSRTLHLKRDIDGLRDGWSDQQILDEGISKKGSKDLNKKPLDDAIKTQYEKLSEDWRQYNNVLWGIPAIAVSIMAGVVVAAYQTELAGWPRFIVLAVGSFFLFVLTLEVIKKRLHMNVVSHILRRFQGSDGLNLNEKTTNLLWVWLLSKSKPEATLKNIGVM